MLQGNEKWYHSVVARPPGPFRVRNKTAFVPDHRRIAMIRGRFNLANSKSARKRILVNERRRLSNRPFRSAARTYIKKAELAIASGDREAAQAAVLTATSTLDRVASKGVIHANNAARRKSRLMRKFNALGA